MSKEYIVNCRDRLFVAYSFKEAVALLEYYGSYGDIIMLNDDTIAHLNVNGVEYGEPEIM